MNTAQFHKEMKEELEIQTDRMISLRDYVEEECESIREQLRNVQELLEHVLIELQKSKKKK